MDSLYVENLSMNELGLIADMRDLKTEKLFGFLRKNDNITYNESPFKSIILDIRSILPKKGCQKKKKS